jgi:hypothetical protein
MCDPLVVPLASGVVRHRRQRRAPAAEMEGVEPREGVVRVDQHRHQAEAVERPRRLDREGARLAGGDPPAAAGETVLTPGRQGRLEHRVVRVLGDHRYAVGRDLADDPDVGLARMDDEQPRRQRLRAGGAGPGRGEVRNVTRQVFTAPSSSSAVAEPVRERRCSECRE